MTLEDYNAFCATLPASHYVMQWEDAHVWKVGPKVFAFARLEGGTLQVTFKAGDFSFELMREQPGLRPAPYLASRGLKWIQHYAGPGLTDEELKAYIRRSHEMVAGGLPKKTRLALGLPVASR